MSADNRGIAHYHKLASYCARAESQLALRETSECHTRVFYFKNSRVPARLPPKLLLQRTAYAKTEVLVDTQNMDYFDNYNEAMVVYPSQPLDRGTMFLT